MLPNQFKFIVGSPNFNCGIGIPVSSNSALPILPIYTQLAPHVVELNSNLPNESGPSNSVCQNRSQQFGGVPQNQAQIYLAQPLSPFPSYVLQTDSTVLSQVPFQESSSHVINHAPQLQILNNISLTSQQLLSEDNELSCNLVNDEDIHGNNSTSNTSDYIQDNSIIRIDDAEIFEQNPENHEIEISAISIGENIRITLPKGNKSKEQNVKEVVNRLLVKALLLNDSEIEIPKIVNLKAEVSEEIKQLSSNGANDNQTERNGVESPCSPVRGEEQDSNLSLDASSSRSIKSQDMEMGYYNESRASKILSTSIDLDNKESQQRKDYLCGLSDSEEALGRVKVKTNLFESESQLNAFQDSVSTLSEDDNDKSFDTVASQHFPQFKPLMIADTVVHSIDVISNDNYLSTKIHSPNRSSDFLIDNSENHLVLNSPWSNVKEDLVDARHSISPLSHTSELSQWNASQKSLKTSEILAESDNEATSIFDNVFRIKSENSDFHLRGEVTHSINIETATPAKLNLEANSSMMMPGCSSVDSMFDVCSSTNIVTPNGRDIPREVMSQPEGHSRPSTSWSKSEPRSTDQILVSEEVACRKTTSESEVFLSESAADDDFSGFNIPQEEATLSPCEEDKNDDVPQDGLDYPEYDYEDFGEREKKCDFSELTIDPESFSPDSQGSFICAGCSVKFNTQDLLKRHRAEIRSACMACPFCDKIFKSQKNKMGHIKRHPASDFKCQFCFDKCYDFQSWTSHQEQHLTVKEFRCKLCRLKCKDKESLKAHKKLHTKGKPHKCEVCKHSFASKFQLKRHSVVHMEGQEVECELCNKVYKNAVSLLKHNQSTHFKRKFIRKRTDFICEVCNEVFRTSKKLSWHLEIHEKWPKKCQFCGEGFVHQSNLTKHIRLKHDALYIPPGSEKDSIICPVCRKAYKRTSFAIHMRSHDDNKPYKCEVCDKAFKIKCNYLAHKWVHLGARERPFKCKLCEKSFHRETHLDAHVRSHKKMRPFTCNECGKSFIYKSNYRSHLRLHTESKSFECSHCGKMFHRKYNLDNHIRIHTGETPFECTICRKEFAQKSNFNIHMKAFHVERQPVHEAI